MFFGKPEWLRLMYSFVCFFIAGGIHRVWFWEQIACPHTCSISLSKRSGPPVMGRMPQLFLLPVSALRAKLLGGPASLLKTTTSARDTISTTSRVGGRKTLPSSMVKGKISQKILSVLGPNPVAISLAQVLIEWVGARSWLTSGIGMWRPGAMGTGKLG